MKLSMYIILFLLAIPLFTSAVNAYALGDSGDGNSLSPSKAIPGDIVLLRGGIFDKIVPGYWTHAVMYVGYSYHYDTERGYWHWDYFVIHSNEYGVHFSSWEDVVNSADEAVLLRVKTTEDIRDKAVSFAKWMYGHPYDVFWLAKQVIGPSYYCSELVWAAYKYYGVDIDANPGWSWEYAYGVAPQEIYDDADTFVVAYSS